MPNLQTDFNVSGFGNPRGNENPFLMSLGILWFRYHNRLAARFKDENPDWEDEQVSKPNKGPKT